MSGMNFFSISSSDVESSFDSLKNGIMEGKMMPVHMFVQTHVNFLNAEVKLNAIASKKCSGEAQKRKRSNSLTEMSPIRMRKRANSYQFEQSVHGESSDDYGIFKKLELLELLFSLEDSIF